MSNKKAVSINLGGGIPFVFLAFFIAKITHYIDWPWAWVLSPLWMGFAILLSIIGIPLLLVGIAGAALMIAGWFESRYYDFKRWKRNR